jgi:Domain of unknown function (DUF1995)
MKPTDRITALLLLTVFMVAIIYNGRVAFPYAFSVTPAYNFDIARSTRRQGTSVGMVSDLFLGNTAKKLPQLPRDVKEAVSKCREATQAALRDRISRMDIEFPVGTKFGIEKTGKKRKPLDGVENKVDKQDLDRSDRELARIFIEMFQPVGGENIVVVFNEIDVADAAKKQWSGDPSAAARIVSMDRRKSVRKVKKSPKMGFAAKLAAEVDDDADESGPFRLPSNTEVAIFVAPGPKELVVIERICETVGMGTLVILLNARLSSISNFGSPAGEALFRNEFQPVFSLAAANQVAAPGCLLHCAYGKSWILARKPKVGQPETVLVQEARPTIEECGEALKKVSPLGVEDTNFVQNAALNIANWFR